MRVINKDKDGNIIPDISKKVIPKDLSDQIVQMIYEARAKRNASQEVTYIGPLLIIVACFTVAGVHDWVNHEPLFKQKYQKKH